ncbi:NAD(P)H-dependent oxidoreductase [Candidatus Bathyarchaeota archaeon]|nr:MAG: NAD(P)H-dependent oxidoreductase [Candidatus Bathyarchaeota archaeon]TMI52607.1 MAG: NAD(P)H-dependent oxidoreductase [Candidatus Bathyarchaeota archaeon]
MALDENTRNLKQQPQGVLELGLLEVAKETLPDNTTLEVFDVSRFPLFTQDHERDPPVEVRLFKQKIRQSDAILFATPEHNYTITAVLKNAIEWANRRGGDNSWNGKPRSYNQCLIGSAWRCPGTATPSPDTGRSQCLSDQPAAASTCTGSRLV